MEAIRTVVLAIYYTSYFLLDVWVNMYFTIAMVLALVTGAVVLKKRKISTNMLLFYSLVFLAVLYGMILLWISRKGGVAEGETLNLLQWIYYMGSIPIAIGIGNKMSQLFRKDTGERQNSRPEESYLKIIVALRSIFVLGLFPILLISPYVFAKADDYSFGYHCHIAWEKTGSLIEVIKAAIVMVKEAYFDWQGTHTSIFMMAIHPAVFDERYYALVPLLFIGLLTIGSSFFLKTLFVDYFQVDKKLSNVCISAYLLLAVQCVPVKQSAFIWYNGAIHYMGSHCVLLLLLAFLLRLYLGKKGVMNWLAAGAAAWYIGGGNHVTSIGTLLIALTIITGMILAGKLREYKGICGILFLFLTSLAINLLAPGNMNKLSNANGNGLIESFFLAFVYSLEYMVGEWLHWTVLIFVLFLLPFLWKVAQKASFHFPLPVLVIGYSWCYMASLFFTPLFSIGTVQVGRFQNIMFLQWMILLMFDITYLFGWLQRRYEWQQKEIFAGYEKKYLLVLLISSIIMLGPELKAAPEKYTSVYALTSYFTEDYHNYSKEYREMLTVLNNEEEIVTIRDFTAVPSFLFPEESETWSSGLRLFYNKKQVIVEKP